MLAAVAATSSAAAVVVEGSDCVGPAARLVVELQLGLHAVQRVVDCWLLNRFCQ